ncbi:MAG: hypothetical protein K5873_12500, partial [Treponema sp.]|nr:hypothetical protein [Treponema sp.]
MKKIIVLFGLLYAGIYFSSCASEANTNQTSVEEEDLLTEETTTTGSDERESDGSVSEILNLLSVVPGAKVTSGGWADQANNGAGMTYPDTDNIILISDSVY